MGTTVPSPQPPTDSGTHDGRPYLLWLPGTEPPWLGMVILHGAGSKKENHADFGRACAAAGWAALAYDQRGHGEGDDEMSPGVLGDVGRMAGFLATTDGVDASLTCVRGSSMGGLIAIHAAATADSIAGAIAICPAREDGLARELRSERPSIRVGARGRAALAAWLAEHDVREAVELMGEKPLLLIHARGDQTIPYQWSSELYERAAEPRKLILVPGGHHRSAQHDAELQGVALRWLSRALAAAG